MSIVHNMARCKRCGDTIESKHVHDYVRCSCGSIAVDGGKDYLRRAWPDGAAADWIEELSEYKGLSQRQLDALERRQEHAKESS